MDSWEENFTTDSLDGDLTTGSQDGGFTTDSRDRDLTTDTWDGDLTTDSRDGNLTTDSRDGDLTTDSRDRDLIADSQDGDVTMHSLDGYLTTNSLDDLTTDTWDGDQTNRRNRSLALDRWDGNFANQTIEQACSQTPNISRLYKTPPCVRRSSSITSSSYYDWRRRLWNKITEHLKQQKVQELMLFYDKHYAYWKDKGEHLDIGLITLGRKGITALFNLGLEQSLIITKNSVKELERMEEFKLHIYNANFVKASLWCVMAMLYTKKHKLGKAWSYITKASTTLLNTEACEFHADCAYVWADIFLTRAKIAVYQNPRISANIKEQALFYAKLSRDICTVEKDKGEWFALYAVESLFLYLRIYIEADLFGVRSTLSLSEFQKEPTWSLAQIRHVSATIKQVETECQQLNYNYPYVKVGLVKCKCILELQYAKIELTCNNVKMASDRCSKSMKMCNATRSQFEHFTGVMHQFVVQTKAQLQAMSHIATAFKHELDLILENTNKRLLPEMTTLLPDIAQTDEDSDLKDLSAISTDSEQDHST